jgi:hypothetical protein
VRGLQARCGGFAFFAYGVGALLCSLSLCKSPPVFARPATPFSLLVQRKGGKRKHLKTHLTER